MHSPFDFAQISCLAGSMSLAAAIGALTLAAIRQLNLKIAGMAFKLPAVRMDGWVERLERSAPRSLRMKWWIWALAGTFFAVGICLFKSIVPAFFGAAFCVLLPDNLSYRRRKAYRSSVLEHLSKAVRLFASEFAVAPQIDRCMSVVARSVPDPVGGIFRRAYQGLIYGERLEKILESMSVELDSKYGQMFVQLVREARVRGQNIAPMFHDLAAQIAVAQQLEKVNDGEISGYRNFGTALVILPLPLYLYMQARIPELNVFLTGTLAGKGLVFLCFLSGILWFFIDRLVSEV